MVSWPFAYSFFAFLMIVFVSQSIAIKLRHVLPMPLVYGALFALAFHQGWLPTDLLITANLVAVGTIAYHVLIIHSGTMVNVFMLKKFAKQTLFCLASTLAVTGMTLLVLPFCIGQDLALLVPGSVLGSGAACAIGSFLVAPTHSEFAFFPWLIFMLQGVFAVPLITWALKKEVVALTAHLPTTLTPPPPPPPPKGVCTKLPKAYKTPAYYLGIIMAVYLLNTLLHQTVLQGSGITPNITALLLGVVFGNLGLVDRAPLFSSDSFGLLLLSLMALMANTLSNLPLSLLLSMVPAALLALALSTVVICLCAGGLSKKLGLSPYLSLAMGMNGFMGFPVNQFLIDQAVAALPSDQAGYVRGRLAPMLGLSTMLVNNALSILIIGVCATLI